MVRGTLSLVDTSMSKAELREHAAKLPRPSEDQSAMVADHLYRHLADRLPEAVLSYLALDDECDLEPLMNRLPGWRWLLPRVPEDNPAELTVHDRGGPLEGHVLGMQQPTADTPVVDPIQVDVALLPGLLFAPDGTRLGRGSGHYDRLLARLPERAERIGVTISARLVPHLPRDTHDITMTAIVTESGLATV